MIILTAISLPYMRKAPLNVPAIVSVELIQITDKTSLPFAPKAKKILEKIKKEKKDRLVSDQAPPKLVKKEKPDAVPLPNKKEIKKKKIKTEKQNPEKIETEIRQSSEFEKKKIFDPNKIAALIDKSKEETAEETKKKYKIFQDQDKTLVNQGLTLSEEDALKAQLFGCWSIPLGLPFNKDLLVRIKLELNPDGTVAKSEILENARMNSPGQSFYRVLAESALRAVKLCQPLRVPTTGYEKWKNLQLNFDANEMLRG
tara:strand:- start:254 stop:1024 length:771 start_codon:yes stop_codon:yes gene_type:complete